jgi:uncharacterized protein
MIEPEVARFFGVGRQDEIFQFLEKKMMIRWCAILGAFAALSLTSAALAEPERASTDLSSQVITGQPSASSPSEAIANKPKANASSKVTASKSKAKPSSQTIAGQGGASASPKAIAAKPKGNRSSKVTTNKPKANPSSKAIAGRPNANPSPKLIASTAKAHPASGAPSGKTTADPAANPSVANANAAMPVRPHRLVIQVDQNDPAVMNLALNNATNVIDYYRAKQQDVQVDLVTYGPGLNMLRDDTSPVKDRIKQLKDYAFPSTVQFSACTNTKENMEKKEGKPISIVSDAVLVPSGVVHLMELQESGWSYVRP